MFSKEIITQTREKYISFIADWPNQFMHKGKNFKELFLLNEDFSYWWLTEIQKKDSESSDVFFNLCRIEAGLSPQISKKSIPYCILLRIKFLISVLTKVLIFKLLYKKQSVRNAEQGNLLFVSLYSITSNYKSDVLTDRYYRDLPERIESVSGIKTGYVSFYYKSALQLLFEIRKLNTSKIIFYESFLSISDVFKAFNLRCLFRYISIEKKREFINSFNFSSKNVFTVFKRELRESFVGPGLVECALIAKAIEKIVKDFSTKTIVCFLETYPYSRAIYYGAKRGNNQIKTVAYQHANITSNKLWYTYSPKEISYNGNYIKGMPMPDFFIFQGRMGKDILVKSGYPQERCLLTGSPRFDTLFKTQRNRAALLNIKTVLVATTYSDVDANAIVKMVFNVSKMRKDCRFIFKAHPKYPLKAALKQCGFTDCIICDEDIHQLIFKSDVLITTYSTTADEAIALGCPVICVDTGVSINMSTFFDIEAAPIVVSSNELNTALDAVFYHPEKFNHFKEKWPQLLEASFYKLDGMAGQRVLDTVKRIMPDLVTRQ